MLAEWLVRLFRARDLEVPVAPLVEARLEGDAGGATEDINGIVAATRIEPHPVGG